MVIAEDNELLFSVLFERDFSPQDAETLLGFKPSKNECKEANIIDDRLLCVLNEFSVLAHGHAMCNYWSYE